MSVEGVSGLSQAIEQEDRDDVARVEKRGGARGMLCYRLAVVACLALGAVGWEGTRTTFERATLVAAWMWTEVMWWYRTRHAATGSIDVVVDYGDPPHVITSAPPGPSRRIGLLGSAVALMIAAALEGNVWAGGVVAVIAAIAVVIVGAQHLYGAWRTRRNARLVLEWERRLGA